MLRPRISTNLAISIDGKITSETGTPSGWTSSSDHQRLLDLRRNVDALLIGRGTLETDRMTLTSQDSGRQPLRCIVSRSGIMDPEHPIFSKPGGPIHLLVTGPKPPELAEAIHSHVTVHLLALEEFLQWLATELGVRTVHCEGGGQLIRALAERDMIDDFHLTVAGHTLFGGLQARTATGLPGEFLPQSLRFRLTDFEPQGEECFLTYTRDRGDQCLALSAACTSSAAC